MKYRVLYRVFTKFKYGSLEWSLSHIHLAKIQDFFLDINDAFRYMEKKQLQWPDYFYEVRHE